MLHRGGGGGGGGGGGVGKIEIPIFLTINRATLGSSYNACYSSANCQECLFLRIELQQIQNKNETK